MSGAPDRDVVTGRGAAAPRYLSVHLPAFRLERTGFGADDLACLVAEERSALRLVALTPAARVAGLRRGMSVTEARALQPDVQLLPLDAPAEKDDRRALVRAFGALSDRVAFPQDDALALEIGEVARVHGGEEATALRAVALAEELGHRVRAAVADDPLAALAIAEWVASDGGVVVVAAGSAAPVLAPLPIQALRPDEALVAALRAVGVETVGRFAALDPAAVAGRYGPHAVRLHRVARGRSTGPVLHVTDDEGLPVVRTALAGATTREEIRFVLPGLLAELADRLEALDLAVVRFRVVLTLDRPRAPDRTLPGAATLAVSGRIGRPTRSPRTLERLVRTRLDSVKVDAPIERITIEVVEAAPDGGWQPGLADRAEAGEPLPDLVARLADQLGDDALIGPVLADAWRPEAAWRAERFPPPPRLRAVRERPSRDPLQVQEAFERDLPTPRPSLLLPKPERLEVACDAGAPVRVRLDHAWRPIERRAGPEHLTGEWWDRPFDREYWVVEVEGRTAWIFRDATAWSLHGWFD